MEKENYSRPQEKPTRFYDGYAAGHCPKTPSSHQYGDPVEIFLFGLGALRKCKVAAVLFKAEGIYYDIDVQVDTNPGGSPFYVRWPRVPGGMVDAQGTHLEKAQSWSVIDLLSAKQVTEKLREIWQAYSDQRMGPTEFMKSMDYMLTSLEGYVGFEK